MQVLLLYDKIIICERNNDIYQKLFNELISKGFFIEKVLNPDIVAGFTIDNNWKYHDFKYSFGILNPDKIFYILRPLCAQGQMQLNMTAQKFFKVAEYKKYIPIVDCQNFPNMYLSQENLYQDNAWDYFYKQNQYSFDEIYSSKNVIFATTDWKEDMPYFSVIEKQVKTEDIVAKFFKLSDYVQQEYNKQEESIFYDKKNVLGVIWRGTDYTATRPKNHVIQPEPEQALAYTKFYKSIFQNEYVYLCTEDESILELFKEFGNKLLYSSQKRYKNTGKNWLAAIHNERVNDEFLRGMEYIISIYMLKNCTNLVAGNCGAARIVDWLVKHHRNSIIFGKYGVDDIHRKRINSKTIIFNGWGASVQFNEVQKVIEIDYCLCDTDSIGGGILRLSLHQRYNSYKIY